MARTLHFGLETLLPISSWVSSYLLLLNCITGHHDVFMVLAMAHPSTPGAAVIKDFICKGYHPRMLEWWLQACRQKGAALAWEGPAPAFMHAGFMGFSIAVADHPDDTKCLHMHCWQVLCSPRHLHLLQPLLLHSGHQWSIRELQALIREAMCHHHPPSTLAQIVRQLLSALSAGSSPTPAAAYTISQNSTEAGALEGGAGCSGEAPSAAAAAVAAGWTYDTFVPLLLEAVKRYKPEVLQVLLGWPGIDWTPQHLTSLLDRVWGRGTAVQLLRPGGLASAALAGAPALAEILEDGVVISEVLGLPDVELSAEQIKEGLSAAGRKVAGWGHAEEQAEVTAYAVLASAVLHRLAFAAVAGPGSARVGARVPAAAAAHAGAGPSSPAAAVTAAGVTGLGPATHAAAVSGPGASAPSGSPTAVPAFTSPVPTQQHSNPPCEDTATQVSSWSNSNECAKALLAVFKHGFRLAFKQKEVVSEGPWTPSEMPEWFWKSLSRIFSLLACLWTAFHEVISSSGSGDGFGRVWGLALAAAFGHVPTAETMLVAHMGKGWASEVLGPGEVAGIAAACRRWEVVWCLLNAPEALEAAKLKETLQLAVVAREVDVAVALLDQEGLIWQGADMAEAAETAALMGEWCILEKMLQLTGANWKAEQLQKPLKAAGRAGEVGVVRMLLEVEGCEWGAEHMVAAAAATITAREVWFRTAAIAARGAAAATAAKNSAAAVAEEAAAKAVAEEAGAEAAAEEAEAEAAAEEAGAEAAAEEAGAEAAAEEAGAEAAAEAAAEEAGAKAAAEEAGAEAAAEETGATFGSGTSAYWASVYHRVKAVAAAAEEEAAAAQEEAIAAADALRGVSSRCSDVLQALMGMTGWTGKQLAGLLYSAVKQGWEEGVRVLLWSLPVGGWRACDLAAAAATAAAVGDTMILEDILGLEGVQWFPRYLAPALAAAARHWNGCELLQMLLAAAASAAVGAASSSTSTGSTAAVAVATPGAGGASVVAAPVGASSSSTSLRLPAASGAGVAAQAPGGAVLWTESNLLPAIAAAFKEGRGEALCMLLGVSGPKWQPHHLSSMLAGAAGKGAYGIVQQLLSCRRLSAAGHMEALQWTVEALRSAFNAAADRRGVEKARAQDYSQVMQLLCAAMLEALVNGG